MPSYKYQAEDGDGQQVVGTVEADNLEAATETLEARSFSILSIEEEKTEGGRTAFFSNLSLSGMSRGVLRAVNVVVEGRVTDAVPSYSYKALNAEGEAVDGVVEAENVSAAINRIQDDALSVLSIDEERKLWSIKGIAQACSKIRPPDIVSKINFFRQLSMMLNGGHTLTEALVLSAEMTDKKILQNTIIDMLIQIQQGGANFSTALESKGNLFPPYVAKLLAVGERTGELPVALDRVADHMEQDSSIRSQLVNSMIYPAVIVIVALVVFTGLAVYVVPQFSDILQGLTQENLPFVTRAWLWVSNWVMSYGVAVAVLLALAVFAAIVGYQMKPGKRIIDRILLRIPFIGTNILNTAMAQMGWTMSSLLESGQNVVDSLNFVANNAGNYSISQSLLNAREAVVEGRSLGVGLRQPYIPKIVQQMCAVGERSGELEKATRGLGEFYQKRTESRIKKTMAIMEPLLILIVAGMVGFIYLGFFNAMVAVDAGFGM